VPTVSYEADILTFARSCTDLNNVGLGDRVLLVDTTFTPDLRLAGRVLQLEEDLLDPALTTVTIGNIIERFTTSNRSAEQRLERVVAESAAWNTSSQQISQNAGKWDQVAQTVVDNAPPMEPDRHHRQRQRRQLERHIRNGIRQTIRLGCVGFHGQSARRRMEHCHNSYYRRQTGMGCGDGHGDEEQRRLERIQPTRAGEQGRVD
jgi:L-fucose mutarotase/ribose pyranase (RbsD/FucU family)